MKLCKCIKEDKATNYFKVSNIYSYEITPVEDKEIDTMYHLYPYKVFVDKTIGLTAVMFTKYNFNMYFEDVKKIRQQKLLNITRNTTDEKL